MDTLERLTPDDLRSAIRAYSTVLDDHRAAINRLNVYPVPDGDTGTNMALTLTSVLAALDELAPTGDADADGDSDTAGDTDRDGGGDADVGEPTDTASSAGGGPPMGATCEAIGHGALMGARGNSGLILSQVLRGMCEGFSELESIGPKDLADALVQASKAARHAVSHPVEGTILSVADASAEGAAGAAADGSSLVEVLEVAKTSGAEALARTPEQLEVLAKAGVVDAGGAGYLLMLDALLNVVASRPLPPAPEPQPGPAPSGARTTTGSATNEATDAPDDGCAEDYNIGDLRYEVMYLLEAPEDLMDDFRQSWDAVGDSIVVVGSGSLWNCHIHTDDIAAAIEAGIDAGRPRDIKITDLMEQVEDERGARAEGSADQADAAGAPDGDGGDSDHASDGDPRVTAVVAVGNGEGIQKIFRSLGVSEMVVGGQSMNPSTAEVLAAIDAAPADQVLVLPNNTNIVAVARQAAQMSDKTVVVLATEGIGEGFAALMEYDPQASAADNAKVMGDAYAKVTTGQVTRSVRSAQSAAGPIEKGDWLGLAGGHVAVVASSVAECAVALLDKLCTEDHELVTLFEGADARPADTRHITEWLAEKRPGTTHEVHQGGQPLYPYLLSVE